MNFARIKGSHNAILSGMQAAEAAHAALTDGRAHDELSVYENGWRASDIGRDLRTVRNVKPLWTQYGLALGVPLGGLDMWTNALFDFSLFGTMAHGKSDAAALKPIEQVTPIVYPKADGKVTFDRVSSVFVSNTNHEEDQPVHLRLTDPSISDPGQSAAVSASRPRLYCPAGVYEVVYADEVGKTHPRFRHQCAEFASIAKTCDVKDPSQNITWVPPEGGGGPNYQDM